MDSEILDASALLALLNQEAGSASVASAVASGALISTVNVSEVVARLSEAGMPEDAIRRAIDDLALSIVDFDREQADRAGLLRRSTRALGLSLGDRACLALALTLGLPVMTADRTWASLSLGIRIDIIR